MSGSAGNGNGYPGTCDFVSVLVANQCFGIPISQVQDVFRLQRLTPVPLSHPDIAGVLNLRGRIVTVIECRSRLGLAPRTDNFMPMAVGVEHKGESYGLVIDSVGEVLTLPITGLEPNPANLDRRWRSVSKGIYRLEGKLMMVLDVMALLSLESKAA